MNPRELIDDAMARAGMNLEQLAERLGKKIRTMKAIRSGEIPLAEDVRLHLRDLVELSRMRRSIFKKPAASLGALVVKEGGPRGHAEEISVRTIPLISWAEAGEAEVWEQARAEGGATAYGVDDPAAIAVRIRGDSMEPDYKHGTVAIVYPSVPAKSGDLVVARLADGSVHFKRLQVAGDDFTFISLNPLYPPVTVPRAKVDRIAPVGVTQREEL